MVVISIHALREEGDASARSNAFMPSNFYPRPPRGGRPAAIAGRCRAADFYPRPPRGGRRAVGGVIVRRSRISIHALREEGDQVAHRRRGRAGISIHALREEGDGNRPRHTAGHSDFYPRPPRGGRLSGSVLYWSCINFYPRPPRGGRRTLPKRRMPPMQFLSTPSARRATSI